jgi:hypothetical protein
MRLFDTLRSVGGILVIATGAVVAALVGRYTEKWLFIPAFIGFAAIAFGLYYLLMRRK